MTQVVLGPTGSRRRRRTLIAPFLLVLVAALLFSAGAQAVHDEGLLELDKDATNDELWTKLGELGQNTNSSTTSINVCTTGTEPATPFTILIDAEKMTVSAAANTNFGGNCPGTKREYTVTRGAGGTTAASHSGGEDVSLLTPAPFAVSAGDDWDQVHALVTADANDEGNDDKCTALGAVECAFTHDPDATSVFTTGGSKDDLDVPNWRHTDSSVPDADEILNAYAAKYIDNGDQILYFGADRFAVNGSKDFGFWFFRNAIGLNDDGTFSGTHSGTLAEPGDILILGTFTQGGAATNIRVFRWVGTGGNATANGTVQGPDATFGDCSAAASGDDGCGTVNNTTIPVPWEYQAKGESASGAIPSGGFLEGGVNLTALGLEGCFSSFLAETRSAPSVDAQLKDFVLGNFEACETTLTTTPADGSGTPLTDSDSDSLPDITIGAGAAGVDVTDSATLVINGASDWAGTLDFYLCGPIASGTCDTGGVLVESKSVADEDTQPFVSASANLTSVGRYCWRGEFTASSPADLPGDTDASTGECFEVLPVTPTLTTQAVDSAGNPLTEDVPFGDEVFDKATLSGTANQPGDNGGNATYPSINATNGAAANGSITFTLIGPGDCTTVAAGTGTNPETGVAVTGDNDYMSSGFTPASPGDYHWQASYTGDSPNTLSTSHNGDCSDTAEDVTVLQLQPTMDTAQSFVPNDSATITVGAGAGDLAGSVVFKLFVNNATCAGTADYTSSSIDITTGTGTGMSKTVVSDNSTSYNVSGTTFHWVVEYTSTNTGHKDVTSACGNEHSSITIDNGVTQPAP